MVNATDVQEGKMKRTMLNHLTPFRMAVIKMIKDKGWWWCGEFGNWPGNISWTGLLLVQYIESQLQNLCLTSKCLKYSWRSLNTLFFKNFHHLCPKILWLLGVNAIKCFSIIFSLLITSVLGGFLYQGCLLGLVKLISNLQRN